jgi:hypothetical protein
MPASRREDRARDAASGGIGRGEGRERRKGDLQRFEIGMVSRDSDGVEIPLSPLSLFALTYFLV